MSSDDLAGLRLMRDRGPAGMDIAAGEYGYDPFYFRRMLDAEAVDVLQADATRCGGISGFMQAARAVRGAADPAFSPHRAVDPCPRRLLGAAGAALRILSRSCANRADAV